ncbi:hemin uptake protein HemP [Pseudomethylobacillus aquaticus]|nr:MULTISPECIES: hemin uptake protein HemP [Methylophilaceae]
MKTPGLSIPRYTSEQLFAGARELIIQHAGAEYRLRLTSQGKLILTK